MYEQPVIEKLIRYTPSLQHVLVIGQHTYAFLDIQLQSDVCVHITEGTLWIIDPSRDSLAGVRGGEHEFVRMPVFSQFLNTKPNQFEQCMQHFLGQLMRNKGSKGSPQNAREAWSNFEQSIRAIDPRVFAEDTSFWQSLIGEKLGAF